MSRALTWLYSIGTAVPVMRLLQPGQPEGERIPAVPPGSLGCSGRVPAPPALSQQWAVLLALCWGLSLWGCCFALHL